MKLDKRPYRTAAVRHLMSLKRGSRTLVVGPTGCGKTVIADDYIEIQLRRGKRILFVAHARQIIDQTYRTLLALGLPLSDVGVLMAADAKVKGHRARIRLGARVQVCSIQTLRLRKKALPSADILIIDEAHHAEAKSYRWLVKQYPKALLIGLTATPFRGAGKGLRKEFDDLYEIAKPSQLIKSGHLAKPLTYSTPEGLLAKRLKGVPVAGGDYAVEPLGKAMSHRTLVGNMVKEYRRLGRGQLAVGFASSVRHGKLCKNRFNKAGIPSEFIDQATPENDRVEILARLDRGELRVVWTYGLLGEGWHQPSVKCVIMARPTRSLVLYLQQAGRILSLYKRQRPIILDHAGNAHRHCVRPGDDIECSLDGIDKVKGRTPLRECPKCHAVSEANASECEECGHRFPPAQPVVRRILRVREIDGQLRLMRSANVAALIRELKSA